MFVDDEKGVVSVEYAFIAIFFAIGLLLVLVMEILAGKFMPGDIIEIDVNADQFSFNKSKQKASAA